MGSETSLEGWIPEPGEHMTVGEIVESAFEYRGDVTVDRLDGTANLGYLFNRNATGTGPFAEMFEAQTGVRIVIPYADIKNIRFTGKDTAAGKSYEAWLRRRDAQSRASKSRAEARE